MWFFREIWYVHTVLRNREHRIQAACAVPCHDGHAEQGEGAGKHKQADAERTVTDAMFESGLADLESRVQHKSLGLLGLAPPSARRVVRESATFVGGGLAALLQLAHPFVAYAIEQHSYTSEDVVGRFVNTFKYVFAVMFGDLSTALRAARIVRRVHSKIHGTLPAAAGRWPAGAPYTAHAEHALAWVFATLFETSEFMYELFVGARTDAERDAHWRYAREVACRVWGLRPACLPGPSYAAFERFYFRTLRSDALVVTPPALAMSRALLQPPHWEQRFARLARGARGEAAGTKAEAGEDAGSLRALTAVLFPAQLGAAFGLRTSTVRYVAVLVLLAASKMFYALLPGSFRYLTKYHEWRLRQQSFDLHEGRPAETAADCSGKPRTPGSGTTIVTGASQHARLSAMNRCAARLATRFVDAYLHSIGSQMSM